MSSGSGFHQPVPGNNLDDRMNLQMEHTNYEKRPDSLSSDHATLTQIASAAAAAGVR